MMMRRLLTLTLLASVACSAERTTLPDRPITAVTVTPATASLLTGESLQATVVITGGYSDPVVTWTSSNPAVATVSDSGLIVAKTVGSTSITAKAGTITASVAITVATGVTSVTVTPAVSTVLLGQSVLLKATVAGPRSNTPVTWSSSNSAIATVNDSGRVVSVALGTATITASAGGFSGSATMTVNTGAVDRVTVCDRSVVGGCSASATLLAIGTSVAVRASAYNAIGTDISSSCSFIWSTNTPLIVTTAFIAGDASKRDAVITRASLGITSIIVTCNAMPAVFTINGPEAPATPK